MSDVKFAFLLVGVSGVGKSSLVPALTKLLEKDQPDLRVFSLDACRSSFAGLPTYAGCYAHCVEHQKEFDLHVTAQWNLALQGTALIIDNMNLSRKGRARWVNDARSKGFTIWGISVMAPLQVLLDRQQTRGDKSVPAQVVEDAFYRQQELLLGSEVDFFATVDGTTKKLALELKFNL